jgi:hypothetical protein
MAEVKTSIDRDNPQQDDVLVGMVATAMLSSATARLVNAEPDQTKWPSVIMRAMIYLMEMGEVHGPHSDSVSVVKLRDLCELHIRRKLS